MSVWKEDGNIESEEAHIIELANDMHRELGLFNHHSNVVTKREEISYLIHKLSCVYDRGCDANAALLAKMAEALREFVRIDGFISLHELFAKDWEPAMQKAREALAAYEKAKPHA